MIEIRVAGPDDISALVELRHERGLLQRRRFAPKIRDIWSSEVSMWLDDAEIAVFVAVNANQLIGYIVGRTQLDSPGVLPERHGVISELVLDLHLYQGGAGRLLVEALNHWFLSCNVERILVLVPHRSPVEQAFWRGLGAMKWMDNLWIK